jgi:hypothetical protein
VRAVDEVMRERLVHGVLVNQGFARHEVVARDVAVQVAFESKV